MKGDNRGSLFERMVGGRVRGQEGAADRASSLKATVMMETRDGGQPRLTGSALEKAYRDLLLEYQVLAESNERLHAKLARRDAGVDESPATIELMRAQRNALVERSHRLRELEYENKNLQRQHKKLVAENRRLNDELAHRTHDVRPVLRREAKCLRDLEQARAELQEKNNDLLRLTDKYYQLESRLKPNTSRNSAA